MTPEQAEQYLRAVADVRRCVIYAQVSTRHQSATGYGLDAYEEMARRYDTALGRPPHPPSRPAGLLGPGIGV